MAAFIKRLDKKHMVTVGLEAFYSLNLGNKSKVNPGDWAASLGTDFIQNSAVENIDFASVHAYPDSWCVLFLKTLCSCGSVLASVFVLLGFIKR